MMKELEAVPKKREFVDVRIRLAWGDIVGRWYGDRSLRPILALHGWCDNIGTWELLLPLLPAHVGVLCVDLPGHGLSSHYPTGMLYHIIDYVHVIRRIMEEFDWQTVSLMGHSLGSTVSLYYTSLFPHTVDLLIAIEAVKQAPRSIDLQIFHLTYIYEKALVEDARREKAPQFPYSYPALERLLCEGTEGSVELGKCKYLLERGAASSAEDPDRYAFTRDLKLKIIREFNPTPQMVLEMGKGVRNIPYCLVKGSESSFINEDSRDLIDLLRRQNPDFEMHEVKGTHHVHLNNAEGVAAVVNPFIMRHRPAVTTSGTGDRVRKSIASISKL